VPAAASLPTWAEIPPSPPATHDCARGGFAPSVLLEGHKLLRGTAGKRLRASDFRRQRALQRGVGDGAERQGHAGTPQVTPRGPTTAADGRRSEGEKSKRKFGKASPTDLTASRRHEEVARAQSRAANAGRGVHAAVRSWRVAL